MPSPFVRNLSYAVPRPSVRSRDGVPEVLAVTAQVEAGGAEPADPVGTLWDRIDPDDESGAPVEGDSGAMAPIGPRPSTETLPPGGMSAYLHAMERNTGATVLDTDGVSL